MRRKNLAALSAFGRREFLQTVALVCAGQTLEAGDQPGVTSRVLVSGSPEAIYLTGMEQWQPQSVLSRSPQRHHWTLLDYETDQLKGVMLVAGQNTAAPEITYPLNRKGWYSIFFGVRSFGYGEDETHLLVRLQSDLTFSLIAHRPLDPSVQNRIDDVFWKTADLTDENLVLRQLCSQLAPNDPDSISNPCHGVWLAYVKLVPLDLQEIEAIKRDRSQKDKRGLFAHNDVHNIFYHQRTTTEEEIRRHIEPLRDTDFARLYWEGATGNRCNYFTKIGIVTSEEVNKDPYRVGDRLHRESWQILRQKGIDPFEVALQYCHEIGLEFHAAYRTAGFHYPPPFGDRSAGGLYERHPEWRGRDRQGRPTPRLSYAYAGVRQFVVSLLKEMANHPIDGVCLLYNRRPPLIEYEPPVVEGFKIRYGKDPLQLEERDPLWLAYRATFLTQFMREVRDAMNQVAKEQNRNRPPGISAIVASSREENLRFAMDLEVWVREGLVDTLIPYTSTERYYSNADSWVDPRDAEFYVRMTKGTSCKLALNLMPRQISPEEYRRRAHRLYSAGVEYFYFWDRGGGYGGSWDVLNRLGHREEVEAWVRAGAPKLESPGSTLRRLGDWDLSYVTPG